MARYKVTARTVDITSNTTLMPENNYGGWFAINQGTVDATVMGYTLAPGEGLDMRDSCPVGSIWDTPIQIIPGAGGTVRITRIQAKEIK